jgi:myo-inositol-1(or 4)-monophosphatase
MHLSSDDLQYLSECAITAAKEAGDLIAEYADKSVEVQIKEGSENLASQVVTEVDLRSESIIVEALQQTCKQYDLGLLAEERGDDGSRLEKDYFWCVDPIDGTLSFIEGVPGYAVSIALVSQAGEPLIGVVYDPLTKTLYSAVKGQGAMRNGEPWTLPPSSSLAGKPLSLVCDRALVEQPYYPRLLEHFESIAEKMGASGLRTLHKGGAVMNGCWVLENPPGCYFKFPKPQKGGGNLWDFAAITCLFNELGAIATDFHGQPLELNRAESTFMNQRGVLFTTDQALVAEIEGLQCDGGRGPPYGMNV